MLTAEQLQRVAELVGQAQTVLKDGDGAFGEPEIARRRVAAFLEEGIRLCRTARTSDGTTADGAST